MKPLRTEIANDLSLSRIIHGHWRLADWKLTTTQCVELIHFCIDMGITTIDTADIYGNYTCEGLFGNALKSEPSLRNKIEIVTKCGIKLTGEKFPDRNIKTYDYSAEYIVRCVDNSLKELGTDFIDLLLLHRPSPLINPYEVSKAFDALHDSGKVRHFGVSNFTPMQFEMLKSNVHVPLVTNQVEISPLCLEHFENGNMDYFVKTGLKPMSWSPLAGGRIFNAESNQDLLKQMKNICKELNVQNIDSLCYAWLLHHPVGILPVIGSHKFDRIKSAVDALSLDITDEQWFRIYIAAAGNELP